MSPQEYLAAERIAQLKSECFNGEMFAMSGGSPHHALITANLTSSVHAGLNLSDVYDGIDFSDGEVATSRNT